MRRPTFPSADFRSLASLAIFLPILCLAGCGGGGGSGSAPSLGTASGHLIVPPNYSQEQEPNDSIVQAQTAVENSVISGRIALGDPGFVPLGLRDLRLGDLFRVQAPAKMNLTLTIAEDDLQSNDLDLFLLNAFGIAVDASEGYTSTEFLEIPGPGLFFVGIRAFRGESAYVLSFTSSSGIPADSGSIPPGADFVPGEILVKWKDDRTSSRQIQGACEAQGVDPAVSYPGGVQLLRIAVPDDKRMQVQAQGKLSLAGSDRTALKALTLDRLRRLAREPAVDYAEPNFIRKPCRVPDDPAFDLQWHYDLINLPHAWDITTGTVDVLVALIDTGALLAHPDLGSRLVGGYDFIRDPYTANDGDGMDPDPTDPGDDPRHQSSSFHGTHVAGTVGAATDNGIGVAAVTWQTRIMPLRALGVDGGSDADISQAIRFAADLPNISATRPAAKARVINMSFAGPGYSQTLQDAAHAARDQGVILVAAAGNESSTVFNSPASLDGVISVSAVDLNSRKAPYSNFGPTVDLAAPGGNTGADLDGDGYVDGVMSTLGTDQGAYTYRFYQGTSMACAHMTGVAALMLAVNPNLAPIDLDLLIAGTHPSTTARITRDLGDPGRDDLYGHGLIDATQALIAARSLPGGGGPLPTGSILAVSTASLSFNNYLTSLSFHVANAGIGTLRVTAITDPAPWLLVSPATGTAPLTVNAVIDRTDLLPGSYSAAIQVDSDATEGSRQATIQVRMEVGGRTIGDVGTVYVLVLDQVDFETVAQAETDASQSYSFTARDIPAGTYLVMAGTDRDEDGLICDIEDACGYLPDPATVRAGKDAAGTTFLLGELASPQSLPVKGEKLGTTTFGRIR